MNKPRLIDANKIIVDAIKERRFVISQERMATQEYVFQTVYRDLAEFINSQPTAYSVDEVVKQLEDLSEKEAKKYRGVYGDERICIDGFLDGIDKAIEIVKGGAVDDETMA